MTETPWKKEQKVKEKVVFFMEESKYINMTNTTLRPMNQLTKQKMKRDDSANMIESA